MLFNITRLRSEGAILPKWRTSVHKIITGRIIIRDYRDDIGQRWMRRATVEAADTGMPIDEIPPLLDAAIIRMEADYMTITGFERIHNALIDRYFDYQQTWYITESDR